MLTHIHAFRCGCVKLVNNILILCLSVFFKVEIGLQAFLAQPQNSPTSSPFELELENVGHLPVVDPNGF